MVHDVADDVLEMSSLLSQFVCPLIGFPNECRFWIPLWEGAVANKEGSSDEASGSNVTCVCVAVDVCGQSFVLYTSSLASS